MAHKIEMFLEVLTPTELEVIERYRKDQETKARLEELRIELLEIMEEINSLGARLVVKNRKADGTGEYLSGCYAAKVNTYLCNGAKEIELIH